MTELWQSYGTPIVLPMANVWPSSSTSPSPSIKEASPLNPYRDENLTSRAGGRVDSSCHIEIPGKKHRLASYTNAPAEVQDAFWREVQRAALGETEYRRWHEETQDEDFPRDVEHALVHPARLPRWSKQWERKAQRAKRGFKISTGPDPLLDIEAAEYVSVLTGEDVTQGRAICCPIHNERTPSFYAYGNGRWSCFGCNRNGRIYDFAGYLWELDPLSRYGEIRDRLLREFS